MKFIRVSFFIVLLMGLNSTAIAQSVFSGANGLIPDFPADTCFKLSLPNIFPAYIDTTFGLQKICLNIEHPSPQDLDITLVAPDNNNVLISRQNGNGEQWEGVCFKMDATTSINSANDFFDVEVLPENNLGEVNNGQLAAGLWQLCIADLEEGNTGTLQNWQLHFNTQAAHPINTTNLKSVCTTYTTLGCDCRDGGDNCFLVPDLIVAEALTLQNFKEVVGEISFTTAISNIGYGPLEFYASGQWYCNNEPISGFAMCEDGQWPQQLVKQRIYRKFPEQHRGFADLDAGFMDYQNTQNLNNRPQIVNWVENTIRIKGVDPNPLNWPVVVNARKTAICIENTLQCSNSNLVCNFEDDINGIGSLPNSRLGQNYICNSNKSGIAVGYSHFNDQNIDGQQLQFNANTCNGTYYLVTEFDPDSLIVELNEFNNVSAVEIQLSEQFENCCNTNFSVSHLEMNGSFIQFEDLTTPIANSWLWDFGDGNTTDTQFPVNQYATPGEYIISLTTQNELGCSSTITKTITVQDIEVNTNDFLIEPDFEIIILSNKAIQLNLTSSVVMSINLLNIEGKFFQNICTNELINKGQHKKLLPDLPTGIYLVQVNSENGYIYKKMTYF